VEREAWRVHTGTVEKGEAMIKRLTFVACTLFAFAGPTMGQTPYAPPAAPTRAPAPESANNPVPWPAGPTQPESPAVPPATAPQPMNGPGLCAGPGCDGAGHFWLTAEYVAAWFHGDNLPPLVTTSPAGTAQAAAGVLGQPGTSNLFGGDRVNDDVRSGFRLGGGYWFDSARIWGVEAGVMVLESQASLFSLASTGSPIVARPLFNVISRAPDAVLIAFPGNTTGDVAVRAASGNFYEAHIDLTENMCACHGFRLDSMLGYRFYRYDEGLRIHQDINPQGAAFVPGTQISAQDDFNTRNEFHGADFGLRAEFDVGNQLCVGVTTRLAVGKVFREVNINGNTVTTVPGTAPVSATGGIYALSSNIGTFSSSDWVVMPDLGINLGWQASSNLRLTLGYSAFLLNRIARAADQVNFNVNPTLFPGATPIVPPNQPAFNLARNDIWVQTLNVGVELQY
jgi:hypothetical protein